MAARMRKRADGRYVVTLTFEDSTGAKQRNFVYGLTRARHEASLVARHQSVSREHVRNTQTDRGFDSAAEDATERRVPQLSLFGHGSAT